MRLAVLGSPIHHSRSPQMHAAAYDALGLDWTYGRAEVSVDALPGFLSALGPEWRGLSLTMPLKRAVLPFVGGHDPLVDRLGLANTVVFGDRPALVDRALFDGALIDGALFNTDVDGIVRVLQRGGIGGARTAIVLGAGATAASALTALERLGVTDATVAARDVGAAARLAGGRPVIELAAVGDHLAGADVVISTLPGSARVAVDLPALGGTPLLDVAYDPWPTALGARWTAAGGTLRHGLDLLIEQAVLQVRAFVGGHPAVPLPAERAVRRAMAAAVGRSGA